jgi:MoxR-like ATPase/predicted RNA-binding protein
LGFEIVKKPIIEEGQKWLAVACPENWKKCLDNHIWGADDNRAQQIKKMRKNDEILVYLVGMKIAAICKVSSEYYYDDTKIWDGGIYPHRVKIEPIKIPTSPIDIKKLYHVYLGYKGSPGGYFGQAIRPLPDNEFAIFQTELARQMNELAKWNNNDFIQEFATPLKVYLENKFSINLTKKRSHIFFNSGAVIHVRGSKIHSDGTGFYYLQQKDYEDTIKNTNNFFVIVFGKVDTVFVIPPEKLKEIFKNQPVLKRDNEEPKWYFDIFENNDKNHFLRIHSDSSSNVFDIENYLNKWEQIPGLNTQNESISVFVTGYNETNVKISKEYNILGWKNKSEPSIGDRIFIYNTTSKKIECGFKITSKSNIEKPIWHDEINSEPPRQIYKYRWEAELVCDNLNIGLEEINQIPPFKADSEGKKAKFGILVLGDAPNSLTKPIYKPFRDYLLNKCDNNKMTEQKETGQIDNYKFPESYWKIAPGEQASQWEEQLANGVIAIGWNELGDLSNKNINDITNDIKKNWPDASNSIILQIKDFLSIREGDIIIANKGISKVIGIGRIVGKYTYRPDLTFNHTYPVKWFDVTERNISPQIGIWRKTISRISQQLYDEIIEQITNNYLLIRHQPEFKRTKNEREYWNDLLGKEYHFGKNVVNYKKIKPGTKTIWFYTDKDKLYLWGHGDVKDITPTKDEGFIASFTDFTLYDKISAAVELEQSTQNKIKSLKSWNPYNSIIEINEEIYNEISRHILQIETFDDEPLPIPSKEQLHKAYLQIRKKLLIDEDTIRNIVSNLVAGKHVLLSGPIGTGKTHLATMISKLVWNEIGGGYYAEMFTATSTWTTQDVIGGIYPKMEDKDVTYAIQKGCVSDTVSRNWKQHGPLKRRYKYTDHEGHLFRGVWLVIDEFNRANIDGAFGEMITALEHGNLKIPTSNKEKYFEELPIPKDYRIIGTLNTFDKHFLFKLSDALKRRFAYIEMLPPVRRAEEEKYYVLKRSSENLDHIVGLREKISLIETEKEHKIDRDKTDQDILRLLDSAYDMFSFIRQTKNLGTAILISIFRYVLVDSMLNDAFGNGNQNINDDEKKLERWKKLENSLDSAFISNIIPQLEGRSKWSLQCILSFCCEQIAVLLQNRNVEQTDFGKYKEEFKKLIKFLGRGNIDEKLDKYQKKQISEEEWSNYDPWKGKHKKPSLPKFRIAINELINESEII